MKKVILIALSLGIVLSIGAISLNKTTDYIAHNATNNTAQISGTISGPNGQAVNNAVIELWLNSQLVNKTKSDINGHYTFKNLSAGVYKLTVKPTYSQYNNQTKSINITENQNSIVDFILNSVATDTTSIVIPPVDINDEIYIEETEAEVFLNVNCDASYAPVSSYAKTESFSGRVYHSDQSAVVHNTESYDFIEENIFHSAKNSPLSTFSIDVDNASYSNVRRFINNNQMPYADAVRLEEMINYFNYDFDQPEEGEPFSVNMEYSDCPWNDETKLVSIGLKGFEPNTENIPATNLVFLIDVSGSMSSQNKLPLLKQSFKILIDKLRPEDRVAIVVYAGSAGCVLPSTSGKDKAKIIASLDALESGGSTAGGAGINLAYKIAKENFILGGNNRVILATDGDFNVGASSDGEMVRLIEEKRDDGIFLSILGFGMGNYKDSKMESLSNAGNGNYSYIDNILEANKVFGVDLWGTLLTIAKDVKIQIEFNPQKVKEYRLIGYENRKLNNEDFNDDKKDAGEIGAGHTLVALYEIVTTDSDVSYSNIDELEYSNTSHNKSNNIMTVKLRYKEADGNTSSLITERIKESDYDETPGSNFIWAAAVAEFGMLLRDSDFKANANYTHVLKAAKSAKGSDENGYRIEFINLVKKAQLLNN